MSLTDRYTDDPHVRAWIVGGNRTIANHYRSKDQNLGDFSPLSCLEVRTAREVTA